MPNGKTHDIISILTFPIVIISTYFILDNLILTIIVSLSYIFASFMFNGDLDTNSKPFNRWYILKMFWIPYQLMFHHRSYFTHGIVIGSVIRIVYVITIPTLILISVDIQNITILVDLFSNKYVIYSLIGIELGSTIHTISDKLF